MTRRRGARSARAALALVAALPLAAGAQEGTAVLEGLVFDSTKMEALPGARVAVFGTSAMTDTDAQGRFRIEGVPAGAHWVSFFHPRLQTLGVSPPSRQVEFPAGERVRIELAVPSERTLLLGWCMAEQPGPGYAALAGVVTDSLTGVPMPRAVVSAAPVGSALPGEQRIEVRTDDSGYYRMCAVPAERELRVQARFGQSSGRSVQVMLEPGGARMQDLMLLMSSEGTLTGTVIDHGTGAPVGTASVSVLGTRSRTLTDSLGRFVLDDLPPGRHLVVTEHVGFEQSVDSVTIFSQETVTAEVRLATEALQIEGLTVTARSRFGRTSLAADAKRADFMTREEIEPLLPRVQHTGDLLRNMNVPGLSVREVSYADPITGVTVPGLCVELRRESRGGDLGCAPMGVFLNDVPVPMEVLRDLNPSAIERIEVVSAIDAAFQFGTRGANGAIMIYTR